LSRILAFSGTLSRQRGNGFSFPRRSAEHGFTLIELMIVITIIGLASAAVMLAMPDPRGRLMDEAERFAGRARAAHDSAIVEARPVSIWVSGGGYGFGCKDPDGRNLAFVCAVADHADAMDEPDHPRKIAHVNLNARDFEGSLRFFTQTLGFRQIDENAPLWFLRCASPDHSSIVLAKTNQPTLNHVAFEMPDFDSVMRGIGRMKDNGYPVEWGPGRHGPGNNVFAYFCGPDEVPIEYASDVLQIDDSYVPRGSDYWKFPPGRSDHWGITQPRSARYYRVQRLFGFTEDGYRLAGS